MGHRWGQVFWLVRLTGLPASPASTPTVSWSLIRNQQWRRIRQALNGLTAAGTAQVSHLVPFSNDRRIAPGRYPHLVQRYELFELFRYYLGKIINRFVTVAAISGQTERTSDRYPVRIGDGEVPQRILRDRFAVGKAEGQ